MDSEVEERKYCIASLSLDQLLQREFLWKGERTKLREQENSPFFQWVFALLVLGPDLALDTALNLEICVSLRNPM